MTATAAPPPAPPPPSALLQSLQLPRARQRRLHCRRCRELPTARPAAAAATEHAQRPPDGTTSPLPASEGPARRGQGKLTATWIGRARSWSFTPPSPGQRYETTSAIVPSFIQCAFQHFLASAQRRQGLPVVTSDQSCVRRVRRQQQSPGWIGRLPFNCSQLPPTPIPHRKGRNKNRQLLRRRTFKTPFKLILTPLSKLVPLSGL